MRITLINKRTIRNNCWRYLAVGILGMGVWLYSDISSRVHNQAKLKAFQKEVSKAISSGNYKKAELLVSEIGKVRALPGAAKKAREQADEEIRRNAKSGIEGMLGLYDIDGASKALQKLEKYIAPADAESFRNTISTLSPETVIASAEKEPEFHRKKEMYLGLENMLARKGTTIEGLQEKIVSAYLDELGSCIANNSSPGDIANLINHVADYVEKKKPDAKPSQRDTENIDKLKLFASSQGITYLRNNIGKINTVLKYFGMKEADDELSLRVVRAMVSSVKGKFLGQAEIDALKEAATIAYLPESHNLVVDAFISGADFSPNHPSKRTILDYALWYAQNPKTEKTKLAEIAGKYFALAKYTPKQHNLDAFVYSQIARSVYSKLGDEPKVKEVDDFVNELVMGGKK